MKNQILLGAAVAVLVVSAGCNNDTKKFHPEKKVSPGR